MACDREHSDAAVTVNMGNRAGAYGRGTGSAARSRRRTFLNPDSEEFATGASNLTINPPSYWVEHGKSSRQASLVVDPPNGRIPPMTPMARPR